MALGFFLVACYATLQPALSVRPSVRRSVGPSVGPSVRRSVRPSHFTFSALMGVLALLLLPKCSTDLDYGPCPPARDWGSRVSGLVFPSCLLASRHIRLLFPPSELLMSLSYPHQLSLFCAQDITKKCQICHSIPPSSSIYP